MKLSTRASALAVAVCALGAVPSAASAAVPAFYNPPASLPSANGAVIKTQAMKLGVTLQLPGSRVKMPGTATRLMYKTTDENGVAVAATGAYIEPSNSWKGGGPRPLVVLAEGTQGQGDQCAPTHTLESTVTVSSTGSIGIGYEVPSIYNLLSRGVAIVVPDYIGLGTPNRVHTYVNRLDQGHAVLDAARAVRNLGTKTSTTTGSPVGFYGYSQGGGATASAAELAPSYAPEINLKGVYAGAPPADLNAVMKTADHTILTGVIGFAVNGFIQNHPELKPILDAETNANGKAALKKVSGQCVGDIIFSFAYARTSQWTKTRASISEVVARNPAAQAVVDAQRIGTIAPMVPVSIVTGTQDDIVGHAQAKQLATDWCALGVNVDYRGVTQGLGAGGTALNHLGPAITEATAAQDWLVNRLQGEPNISDCDGLATRP